MKKLFIFSLAACSFIACSKSDSNKSNKSDSIQQTYRESYKLELNGCSTGPHQFESNVSPSDARKQLCIALQDDELNKSCAEPLRRDHFSKLCSDMSWKPVYAGNKTTTPSVPSAPSSYQNETAIESRLFQIIMEDYKISDALTDQNKKAAGQIAEDMKKCGFGYLGISCLYTTQQSSAFGLVNLDGKDKFYSEVQVDGIPSKIYFIFDIEVENYSYSFKTVHVYRGLKLRNPNEMASYLKDASSLEFLFDGNLAADVKESARKHLKNPSDLPELFHMSRIFITQSLDSKDQAFLKEAISKNRNLITDSKNATYQREMLSTLMSDISISAEALKDICGKLIQSKNETIQQLSAIVLLQAEPTRSDLKPLVLKSLSSTRWEIRKKAILALSKVKLTGEEENQILQVIADPDEDVQKAAIAFAASLELKPAHFKTIQNLSQNKNWSVRAEAVKLLSRLNTPEANQQLIGMLSDSDDDVRNKAAAAIGKKDLNETSVSDLTKQLHDNNWAVRKQAVVLLGKIKSKEATLVLISDLDDSDDEIRSTIMTQLRPRSIDEDAVTALKEKLTNRNWDVRKKAVELLGTNQGDSSTSALIAGLDDSDQDVQTKIFNILDSRELTEKSVEGLKIHLSKPNWNVRKMTARLLGKIKSKASLAALEERLPKETDQDVQNQIKASIQKIKS